jgi:hypothetical protein
MLNYLKLPLPFRIESVGCLRLAYLQPFDDPKPLARPPAWKKMPGKEPICRRPGTAFAERELVKRTMTYRERSLVKCVLTNLRLN